MKNKIENKKMLITMLIEDDLKEYPKLATSKKWSIKSIEGYDIFYSYNTPILMLSKENRKLDKFNQTKYSSTTSYLQNALIKIFKENLNTDIKTLGGIK